MATDREVLLFIHERLEHRHGESAIVDYMHSLRRVIAALPPEQRSPATCTNSLEELRRQLPVMDALKAEGWLRRRLRRLGERWTKQPHTDCHSEPKT